MGKTSVKATIYGRLANVSVWAQEVFFLLRVVLGHFLGVFPSVPIATPKMPGVAIIKGPLTALKKKFMSPRALFWPLLAFLAYCGSRAVPITGIW